MLDVVVQHPNLSASIGYKDWAFSSLGSTAEEESSSSESVTTIGLKRIKISDKVGNLDDVTNEISEKSIPVVEEEKKGATEQEFSVPELVTTTELNESEGSNKIGNPDDGTNGTSETSMPVIAQEKRSATRFLRKRTRAILGEQRIPIVAASRPEVRYSLAQKLECQSNFRTQMEKNETEFVTFCENCEQPSNGLLPKKNIEANMAAIFTLCPFFKPYARPKKPLETRPPSNVPLRFLWNGVCETIRRKPRWREAVVLFSFEAAPLNNS